MAAVRCPDYREPDVERAVRAALAPLGGLATHLRPGQTVRVELLEGRRQVLELPVTGTVQEMMGMGAYIERRSLNRLLQEGDLVNSASLFKLDRAPIATVAFFRSLDARSDAMPPPCCMAPRLGAAGAEHPRRPAGQSAQ